MVIVLSGFACAFASLFASLAVSQALLPPADGAYGLSVIELLGDPFVRTVAVPVTLTLGGFGSLCALFLLARTDLRRSIPFVACITVAATAAFSVFHSLVAAPIGLVIGIWAMTACRVLFPRKHAQSA